jgi:hypothetical protein
MICVFCGMNRKNIIILAGGLLLFVLSPLADGYTWTSAAFVRGLGIGCLVAGLWNIVSDTFIKKRA